MKIERFEDIKAWRLARELTKRMYALARKGRSSRDYGLIDQIQRTCGSIMHNIAEGFDAGSNSEFVRFLGYAKCSCTEVQSALYIALDQKYVSKSEFNKLYKIAEVTQTNIAGFIKYLLESKKKIKASGKS